MRLRQRFRLRGCRIEFSLDRNDFENSSWSFGGCLCGFIRRVLRTPTLTPKRSVRVPQVAFQGNHNFFRKFQDFSFFGLSNGAKHSPSLLQFGGPSGWFWGNSFAYTSCSEKQLIFWIWTSNVFLLIETWHFSISEECPQYFQLDFDQKFN